MPTQRRGTDQQEITGGVILMFGIAWGVWETLLPLAVNAVSARMLLGAALAGTAFFFLCGARHAGGSRLAPAALFAVAAGIKTLGVTLVHGFPIPSALSGPLAALLLQALLFAVLPARLAGRGALSAHRALIPAALAGLLSGLLFPLFSALVGWKACLLPGTAIPASIAYAPLTMVVAAFSGMLGRAAGLRLGKKRSRLRPAPETARPGLR